MGMHAGSPSAKHGRYRGLHSDKPVLEEYEDLYAESPHGVRLGTPKAWTAVALAAVVMALTAGALWLTPNQTGSHRNVLSAPTRAPQRASVQPTESPSDAPVADPSGSPQPVPTATVTLPGSRQTVTVTAPAMEPQAAPSPQPGPVSYVPGPAHTAYRPVPGPTVTVTRSVPAPGPTVTEYVTKPAKPRIVVTVTVTVPPLP